MKLGVIGALATIVLLAGCGSDFETGFSAPIPTGQSENWAFNSVSVDVPDTLIVSDRNRFAPRADIVWHGDPEGDRKAQVGAVLESGIAAGAAGLPGKMPVDIEVTLIQFHGVTPRAASRAPSAVHNIAFTARVVDAETGEALTADQRIDADLQANTGQAALEAANRGQTQKARVTEHVAAVTAAWLGIGPDVRGTFRAIGR